MNDGGTYLPCERLTILSSTFRDSSRAPVTASACPRYISSYTPLLGNAAALRNSATASCCRPVWRCMEARQMYPHVSLGSHSTNLRDSNSAWSYWRARYNISARPTANWAKRQLARARG